MNLLYYLAALASGMANPAQAGANAQLRKGTENAIFSAVVVYGSGLLCMLLAHYAVRELWPSASKLTAVPWWAWLGGVLSIASTLAGIMLAQKMGSGTFTGLTLTASVTTSLVLDHFGWLGFSQHTATWPRVAGGMLMIIGLCLVSRY